MKHHKYWVYIITNPNKTIIYVGITNDLSKRLKQHYENRGASKTFAGKYFCYNLLHFEEFQYVSDAIAREKQIKKWNRTKKNLLITRNNPNWKFQNDIFI